ncbi:hypothetical protein [Peribacillus aracenensis]|nr:hypothetical protein [Peribacillus sp. BBB004]
MIYATKNVLIMLFIHAPENRFVVIQDVSQGLQVFHVHGFSLLLD